MAHIHYRGRSSLHALWCFYALDSYGLQCSSWRTIRKSVPFVTFFIFFFILNRLLNLLIAYNFSPWNLFNPLFALLFLKLELFDFVQNTNFILSGDFDVFFTYVLHKFLKKHLSLELLLLPILINFKVAFDIVYTVHFGDVILVLITGSYWSAFGWGWAVRLDDIFLVLIFDILSL